MSAPSKASLVPATDLGVLECRCGYRFPAECGRYGCPNCNGDAMSVPLSSAERQANSRKRRAEAGGKQVAVVLTPAAAAKLARWQQRGLGIADVINGLLERSRP